MIERVYNNTLNFIKTISKEKRKEIGQFFTQPSIAEFMAKLMVYNKKDIKILDAGAGSGILTAALCDQCLKNKTIVNIHVDLYENNKDIIPLLEENMKYIKKQIKKTGRSFSYTIIEENFILYNSDFWNGKEKRNETDLYDVIISNPPYMKIRKNDIESATMKNIVHGQPNMYFLFMAMAAKLLRKEGQMIFINPRSFTSGAYFRKFREWFLSNVKITNIHLFHSRNNIFKTDKILQETLILKAIKLDKHIDTINITTSSNAAFDDLEKLEVSKDVIINKNTDNFYILIPTNIEELEIINLINNWKYTMPELGFKLSTGKVVDFRATEFLKNEPGKDTVPLIWPCNFNDNKVKHPVKNNKSPQFIVNNQNSKSLLMDNKDYILIKRFSSKEESKRIQCALYLKDDFNKFNQIAIENHLNYINGDMTIEEMYGLFTILNSSYIDRYYRILNGSTQVNATEMNSIPMPDIDTIIEIGKRVIIENNISVQNCDKIIKELFIENKLENVI